MVLSLIFRGNKAIDHNKCDSWKAHERLNNFWIFVWFDLSFWRYFMSNIAKHARNADFSTFHELLFSPRLRRLPWHRECIYAIWLVNFDWRKVPKLLLMISVLEGCDGKADNKRWLEYWQSQAPQPGNCASSFRSGWEYLDAFIEDIFTLWTGRPRIATSVTSGFARLELLMSHVLFWSGPGPGLFQLYLVETDCGQLSSCFCSSPYILFKGCMDLPKS